MMTGLNRLDFLKGLSLSSLAAATGCVSASGGDAFDKPFSLSRPGVLHVPFPGVAEDVRIWVVGDTHFALHDARDEAWSGHYRRMAQWPAAKEPFERMLARAAKERPDLLLLVGDNISFPTLANIEYLKAKLDGCGVPWMYVAGNHDWHFEGDSGSDIEQRARWTSARLGPLYQGADPLMASRVVKGIRVVTIDNSVYHVLPEQVEFWKQEAAKGDPVVLAMHIPFWQPGFDGGTCCAPGWGAATDRYWEIERRERWAERLMPSTFAFRDAVLSTPNLVGVFAGHIHVFQSARAHGQNLFTVPANGKGDFLDVRIGPCASGVGE